MNWNIRNRIPRLCKTDSYKAGHFRMYPKTNYMSAYIEARKPFRNDDGRIVFFGMQYFIDNFLSQRITMQDVEEAESFFKSHGIVHSEYPFPADLFRRVVTENDGYWPVTIQSLPDATIVPYRTPQVMVSASGEYAPLVTYLETVLLSTIWYMSTVATQSAYIRRKIENAFRRSAEESSFWKIDNRLHDFGYRGVSSEESSIMGGLAHLLSFDGTDTVSAAYASRILNGDSPSFDCSIPATEHSIMTCWDTEMNAVLNMVENFGHTVFATVADSYDYEAFLDNVLPVVAPLVKAKGGFHVIRPDSGDPVTCVLQGLEAGARHYGYITNAKGYKVLNNCGVIQGDGINADTVVDILNAVMGAGFSAENVAFGMGGGLLQAITRDTCSYAMKLSQADDRMIVKLPKTDLSKASYPGRFSVFRREGWSDFKYEGTHTVIGIEGNENSLLQTVWDNGPVGYKKQSFSDLRAYIRAQSNVTDVLEMTPDFRKRVTESRK